MMRLQKVFCSNHSGLVPESRLWRDWGHSRTYFPRRALPATQIRKEFLAHRSHRLTQIKEIEEACFFLAGIRTRKEKASAACAAGRAPELSVQK